jgi:hypothetical protein
MDLPGNDGLFLAPSHYGFDISMQFSWEREDGCCEEGDIIKLFEKTPRDQVLKLFAKRWRVCDSFFSLQFLNHAFQR